MLRTKKVTRKQAFRAALSYAGIDARDWAAEQGVTPQHMYAVLKGDRESKRLTDAIDAFIAKHSQVAA